MNRTHSAPTPRALATWDSSRAESGQTYLAPEAAAAPGGKRAAAVPCQNPPGVVGLG